MPEFTGGRMDIVISEGQTLEDAMKIRETNPITEADVEKADFGTHARKEDIDAILALSEEDIDDLDNLDNIKITQEDLARASALPNISQEEIDDLLK